MAKTSAELRQEFKKYEQRRYVSRKPSMTYQDWLEERALFLEDEHGDLCEALHKLNDAFPHLKAGNFVDGIVDPLLEYVRGLEGKQSNVNP